MQLVGQMIDKDLARGIVFEIRRTGYPEDPCGFGGLQIGIEGMGQSAQEGLRQGAFDRVLQVQRLAQEPVDMQAVPAQDGRRRWERKLVQSLSGDSLRRVFEVEVAKQGGQP